jgi:hypothetical protein
MTANLRLPPLCLSHAVNVTFVSLDRSHPVVSYLRLTTAYARIPVYETSRSTVVVYM